MGNLRNRANFARKFEGKFEESEFLLEKSGQIISRHAAQKFASTKTMGSGKIREQNFAIVRRKAPKFTNFVELRSHYFCTIL